MHSQPLELMSPTSRSWAGMKRVLFQPFDIKKWFVLGFTAWLATLMEGGGSSGSGQTNSNSSGQTNTGNEFQQGMDWVQQNIGLVITVLSIALIVGLTIVIALTWVRSRGKLMFLDNVVHNRTLVKQPWAQFKTLGNSLFCWNLGFWVIAFFMIVIPAGGAAWFTYIQMEASNWVGMTGDTVLSLVGMGLVLLILMLVLGFVSVLLEDFVIPIMYKHGLKTNDAWRKFLPILRQRFWRFVLYAIWRILLGMGAGVAVILFGLCTCCIGFIPLMIPYLSAVLLLPVSVFFRFLGPEYLRQFGPDYDLWHMDVDVVEQLAVSTP